MKRNINVIVFYIFFASQLYGQFGVRSGLNIASYRTEVPGNFISHSNPKTSAFIGFYSTFDVSEKVKIVPEFTFSRDGGEFWFRDGRTAINLDYVTVPVTIKYFLVDSWNIHAGPNIAYLVRGKRRNPDELIDIQNDYRNENYGFHVGMEGNYETFNIGARYYHGLSDISRINFSDTLTRAIQVYLAYNFDIKKQTD